VLFVVQTLFNYLPVPVSKNFQSTQVKAIGFYGGASEGMRTMLDAFIPAVTALESGNFMLNLSVAIGAADVALQ
jgi:hypothetical protein